MDVVKVSWTVDADVVVALIARAAAEQLPVSRVASRLLREALDGAVAVATEEQTASQPALPPAPVPPRSTACPMVVPRGVKCKACGKVH